MLNGAVPKNILFIGLDLDYSHFNSSKRVITWFGSKTFWVNLYQNIIARAAAQGVEIKFAIISKKPFFDDICAEATTIFQDLLKTTSTPMYVERNSKQFCLVDIEGKLKYESLVGCVSFDADKDTSFSHVMLLKDYQLKSTAFLTLANKYGIPANQCIMIDDTPEVLEDVSSVGIHAISLACFHDALVSTDKFADHAYVQENLAQFEKALNQKVDALIAKLSLQEKQVDKSTPLLLTKPVQSVPDEAAYSLICICEKLEKLLEKDQGEPATPDAVEAMQFVKSLEFRFMQDIKLTIEYHFHEKEKRERHIKNRFT